MRIERLYEKIAQAVVARENCMASKNSEWFERHTDHIEKWVKDYLPHGSGFDSGTTIDLDKSTRDRLVFHTSFHHMDDMGGYDGWTDHTVTVRPSLGFQFTLTISGRNRNDIKDVIYEAFDVALRTEIKSRV